MNVTLKFGINTHELMPNGEVLFLIRQKLMKRVVSFKKKTGDFVRQLVSNICPESDPIRYVSGANPVQSLDYLRASIIACNSKAVSFADE